MTLRVYSINTFTETESADVAARPSSNPYTMMAVGGTRVALGRGHADCRICHNGYRTVIEQLMTNGASWKTINGRLPPGSQITEDAYRAHFVECYADGRGLNMLNRMLAEDRNELEGFRQADPVAFLNLVVNNAIDQAMNGGFNELKPMEALAFSKALIEAQSGAKTSLNEEVLSGVLRAYLDTVRSVCTPEQQAQIAQALDANPELRILALRMQGKEIDTPVVEALPATGEVIDVWDSTGFVG